MNRVAEKVAIVTGGASGIGRTSCSLLAKEGAKVAVVDIDDDAGNQIVTEIKDDGGIAQFWHVDVANMGEVQQAFQKIYERFSRIDILVNNAGIHGIGKPSHEIEESEWDRVINVNLKSVFLCTKHVIPFMKKSGGGSIVNISSIFGIVGGEDPPYHASKGGVRLLTKSDAFYYAHDRIRVNSIHPGFTWTPLFEDMASHSPEGIEAFRKRHEGLVPLGRVGEPIDVALGVLYLASDESRFVTGAELVIDGGYTSM